MRSKERLQKQLTRWCNGSFADIFAAWVHLKAIKVFVEAVLRYCLPPNFVAMLVRANPGQESKLRAQLNQTYAHLGSAGGDGAEDDEHGAPAAGGHSEQFYRYVYTELNISFS